MSIKINNSNIAQLKINGNTIGLAKFNGYKLFELFKEKIISLTPKTLSDVYKNSDESISNFTYDETTGNCSFDVTINTTESWAGLKISNEVFAGHDGDYVRISVDSITSGSSLSNCYLTHYISYNISDDTDQTSAWYDLSKFTSYDDKVVIANEFDNLYFCVYSDVTVPITVHIEGLKAEIITRPIIKLINEIYGSGYNKNYNYKVIQRKRDKITELLNKENTICFTQLSDLHFDTNNLESQNGYSQLQGAILSSKIFEKCNAIIIAGDYWNEDATEEQLTTLSSNLEKIINDSKCSVLNVKGNHDVNMYSASKESLVGDKMFNNLFTDLNKYVGSSPNFDTGIYEHQNYYYVDDATTKHRYIVLNSFETDPYFDKFTELVGTSDSPIDFYPIWEKLADNNEKYFCILEGATLDDTSIYNFSRQLGYFQKNDNILYFYSYTDQNYNNYSVDTTNKTCSWNNYSDVSLYYPYTEGTQSENQLNWLKDIAMNMSNKKDWTVSIHTHDCMVNSKFTTYFASDKPYMRKLFKAFKYGENFTYSQDGISISKDFTSQGAIELIGVFAGHIHLDSYSNVEGVNYYINNASKCQSELYSNVNLITPARSWIGECSMSQNFYIYNRDTKKMNVIVLGVGEDKEFDLAEEPIDNNLLDLSESNWEWSSNDGEASALYNSNDNTISLTYDGTSSFGLNISQENLTLSSKKIYKLSCDNIGGGTYISINNNSTMALNSSKSSVEFTPTEDIANPQIVIWCDKNNATYENTIFNIKLEEV